jgi:hypothetical protein
MRRLMLLILSSTLFIQQETKTLNFGAFTIEVPVSWDRVNVQGIDSYVGRIRIDDQDAIGFDLGRYSNPLRFENTTSYIDTIDNKSVKIVRPKYSGTGITGIYIDSIGSTKYGNIKFELSGNNLDPENEELVLKAIKTIKFTKK